MQPFLSEDFLLSSRTARTLYHEFAEGMPIFDYHCHLPAADIAADKNFENLTDIWLRGDHRKEPPGSDHPLLQLPQVVATPHTGAHSDEAVNAMGRMALDACLAVLRGERPAHIVNPDVYQRPDRL